MFCCYAFNRALDGMTLKGLSKIPNNPVVDLSNYFVGNTIYLKKLNCIQVSDYDSSTRFTKIQTERESCQEGRSNKLLPLIHAASKKAVLDKNLTKI